MRQNVSVIGFDPNSKMKLSWWSYQYPFDTLVVTLTFYTKNGTVTGTPLTTSITQNLTPVTAWLNFEDDERGSWFADKNNQGQSTILTGGVTGTGLGQGLFRVVPSPGATYTPAGVGRWAISGWRAAGFPLRSDFASVLQSPTSTDTTFSVMFSVRSTEQATSPRSTLLALGSGPSTTNYIVIYFAANSLSLQIDVWRSSVQTTAVLATVNPGDWYNVAFIYNGTAVLAWVTQSTAFTNTPTATLATGAFSTGVRLANVLVGGHYNTNNNPALNGGHTVDLVTYYKSNIGVTGLNAWKSAIESSAPMAVLNWGYTQKSLSSKIPADANRVEARLAATDTNSDGSIQITVDDISLSCTPNE